MVVIAHQPEVIDRPSVFFAVTSYLGPFDGDGGITLGFALQLGEFVAFGRPSHF